MDQTASSSFSGTSGDLSAVLSNLTANTTYYYKAFVTVNGTGDYSSQSNTFYGTEYSFKTKAVSTATVTTSAASSVSQTGATLNGSFSGATGTISEVGFEWAGASATVSAGNGTKVTATGTSSPFSKAITGLTAGTTYYYRAYVKEANENTNSVDTKYGSVVSFTTTSSAQNLPAYLSDYGMPDVSGIYSGLRAQSSSRSDRDDYWYSYNTNNNKRQIAVHTYATGAPNNAETLNYVVLYDETKYAPVWTYHVMNTTYWPDNDVGRTKPDPWTNDPAISLTQQDGLDNAGTVGYSRGHLVASNYRQTTTNQNKQTFYYSNQAPQWQDSFNSGVWSSLEEQVAAMAPDGTTMLYVVTGVLYEGTVTTLPSNGKNVPIPSHFYKCIMRCTFSGNTINGAQGIAFVYSNQAHLTTGTGLKYYGTDHNTGDECFVTSIDAIEQRAGFDFFAGVPDNLENTAEANTNHNWFTGQSSSNISSVTENNWGSF